MIESQTEHQNLEAEARKTFLSLSRIHVYFFLLGSLLLPTIVVAFYAAEVKGVFFVALSAVLMSGIGGWLLLRSWEFKMQQSVSKLIKLRLAQARLSPYEDEVARLRREIAETTRGYEHQIDLLQSSVAKSKDEVHHLNLEMDEKLEQMRLAYLEFEDLRKEYHRLEEEYSHAIEEMQKEFRHKDSLLSEYQRTMTEQRMIIEKKQHYIAKLEGKIGDLMNEIRSLLQLEDLPTETPPQITEDSSHFNLSVQLKRYIEKAESQTGMDHLGGKSPRFLDLSESYVIDRRRLFDCFREESVGIIFILSLTEKKFLFVNQLVKTVLGWSSEKFMKEFPKLVKKGYTEWAKAVVSVNDDQESQTRIVMECKSGEKKEFVCMMGMISKGPFANHIIGILS